MLMMLLSILTYTIGVILLFQRVLIIVSNVQCMLGSSVFWPACISSLASEDRSCSSVKKVAHN
jgi:hypothetical protein